MIQLTKKNKIFIGIIIFIVLLFSTKTVMFYHTTEVIPKKQEVKLDEEKYKITSDEDFVRNYNYAMEEIDMGNYDKATLILQHDVDKNSTFFPTYNQLLLLYLKTISKYNENIDNIFNKGLKVYEKYSEEDKKKNEIKSLLIDFYTNRGLYFKREAIITNDEEVPYLEKAISLIKENEKYQIEEKTWQINYKDISLHFMQTGKPERAKELYIEMYDRGIKDNEVINNLAKCYELLNDLENAEKVYNEGISKGYIDSMIGLSILKGNKDDYFKNLKVENKDKVKIKDEIYTILGNAYEDYFKKDLKNKALKELEKALEIASSEQEKSRVVSDISRVYLYSGEYDKVIEILEPYVKKGNMYPAIYSNYLIATSYLNISKYNISKKCFENGIESLYSKNYILLKSEEEFISFEIYFSMSNLSFDTQLYYESLSYVIMAKKYLNAEIIEKNDGNQVYHLEANNYMYLGKFDEAINSFIYYSKTLKKEDVDIYNNIAICYEQIKDNEKAKEYFRKAAKLGDEMAKKELKKLEQSKN